MSVKSWLIDRFFGDEISHRVSMAVRVLDDSRDRAASRQETDRDRRGYDRDEVNKDALEIWRQNPLARRIVGLTSQYVVGGGIMVECSHAATSKFLNSFWVDRLNRMQTRLTEWCDELTRAGELFIVLTTDVAGMSYVRAVPASQIEDIETAANDVEQAIRFIEKPTVVGEEGKTWPAYNHLADFRRDDGSFPEVMMHYAINRPIGAKFGESDLSPLTRWLNRYSVWLEDRVRLNRFRQAFLWVVAMATRNKSEVLARQAELNANPPAPGSILVTDGTEAWGVQHPKLDSFEASEDGLAIKKYIAAGSGNPLHFLSEPESSTRTTAEQAGGPTFRHYESRQIFFLTFITDICQIVVRRRAMIDGSIDAEATIKLRGTDIFARDNAALSAAAATIINSFVQLRDRGLVDDAEVLRLAYRFAGEVVDVQEMLERGKKAAIVISKQPDDKPPPKTGGNGGGNLTPRIVGTEVVIGGKKIN